jgi:hypothetical protein
MGHVASFFLDANKTSEETENELVKEGQAEGKPKHILIFTVRRTVILEVHETTERHVA